MFGGEPTFEQIVVDLGNMGWDDLQGLLGTIGIRLREQAENMEGSDDGA